MKVQESAEDYLEMVLILQQKGPVHAVDIARELGFSKPSVSIALKNLKEERLIDISPEREISLTPHGSDIAEKIYERHVFISDFLIRIGVDKTTAIKEACRIEHVISQETFEKMKAAAAAISK